MQCGIYKNILAKYKPVSQISSNIIDTGFIPLL